MNSILSVLKHRQVQFLVRTLSLAAIATLLTLYCINIFIMRVFSVPTESMTPTLPVGTHLFVNKLAMTFGHPYRGEVIVFKDEDHWQNDNGYLTKRVIGLPGDHVVVDSKGVLYINGQMTPEPYIHGQLSSTFPIDIYVPKGRVWVMGDNRNVSSDSRFHDNGSHGKEGSISTDSIVGSVVAHM